MTGSVIASQGSSRYHLPSQDLSNRNDHFSFLSSSSFSRPLVTGKRIEGMRFSTENAVEPVSAPQYGLRSLVDDSNNTMPSLRLSCQDTYIYPPDSNAYAFGQGLPNENHESLYGPLCVRGFDNSSGIPYVSTRASTPLDCPRSHSRDVDAALRAANSRGYQTSCFPSDYAGERNLQAFLPDQGLPTMCMASNQKVSYLSRQGNDSLVSFSPTLSNASLQSIKPESSSPLDERSYPAGVLEHRSIMTPISAMTPESVEGLEYIKEQDGEETDVESCINSEPYAQLIYRALKSVPGHRMVLKEIYEWFEKNTDKANDPSSKGWQNSIRHNLSMNGAFTKVEQAPPGDDTRKGYVWVLEPCALEEGVKSTTRFRRQIPNKKACKSGHADPRRQRSGAKGGKAAKKNARLKRNAKSDDARRLRSTDRAATMMAPIATHVDNERQVDEVDLYQTMDWPQSYCLTPPTTAQSSFDFSDIAGCADGLSTELYCPDAFTILPSQPSHDLQSGLAGYEFGCQS